MKSSGSGFSPHVHTLLCWPDRLVYLQMRSTSNIVACKWRVSDYLSAPAVRGRLGMQWLAPLLTLSAGPYLYKIAIALASSMNLVFMDAH